MKKNLITVLKKLLKAFGGDDESVKNNAVDIIDKIADNASSGGSGGLSVLTLYGNIEEAQEPLLYKNIELTEGYSSVEEADEALLAAAFIRVALMYNGSIDAIFFPTSAFPANSVMGVNDIPMVNIGNEGNISLYIESSESENPDPENPDPSNPPK